MSSQSHQNYFFYRNLQSENINLNLSINVSKTLPVAKYELINSSVFSMDYLSYLGIELKNYTINPRYVTNSIKYSFANITIFNSSIADIYLNGSSFISYKLNNTFSLSYHLIAFRDNKVYGNPSYLWFASNHNVTKAASLVILNDNLASFSYGNQSMLIPFPNLTSGWNYVLFKATEHGLLLYINGVKTQIVSQYFDKNEIFTNNSYFNIGYPNYKPISFKGYVSPLYSSLEGYV